MEIQPLHADFGARITGFDLSEPLDGPRRKALLDAIDRWSFLCFPDQAPGDERHLAFTREIGEPEPNHLPKGEEGRIDYFGTIGNVQEDGTALGNDHRKTIFLTGNNMWHTDASFKPVPAFLSINAAYEVHSELRYLVGKLTKTLDTVLLTHHHGDHVEGLPGLLEKYDPEVIGAAADKHRLPDLDRTVSDGDTLEIAGEPAHIMDVSGHTVGHIAIHFPESHAVFTADSLMALGCGRVFEGTMEQMWGSLSKLAALPDDTVVYSGHEYTAANARFAMTIEPDNADLKKRSDDIDAARANGQPTVPSSLALEKATNPFLRAGEPSVQENLGMSGANPVTVFAEIRRRKDSF